MAASEERSATLEAERDRVARELLAMRRLPLAQRDEKAFEEASARLSALVRRIADANEKEADEAERKETTMSTTKKQNTSKKQPKKPAAQATVKPAAKPAAPAPNAHVAPDARPVAPTAAEGAKGKGKPAPAPKGRTMAQDPRLPAVGAVIEKRDRHGAVRCECKVEEGGIRYGGMLYSSVSSAALAAARDLGLKNKTQNGFIFWGLVKPPRPAGDPVEALEKAWERYRERAEAVTKAELEDEARKKVVGAMVKHAMAVEKLVGTLK